MKLLLITATAFCLSFGAGQAVAQDFVKGADAYEAGDFKTALSEWLPLAQQGDAAAQNNLGWMYFEGKGVVQDYAEAVKWYRLAADQGAVQAINNLGFMYGNGAGVAQDHAEAIKWFRLAAEQGDAVAVRNLGVMHWRGEGVPHDILKAHMWFNLGAAIGDKESTKGRDALAAQMTTEEISTAQAMANTCMSSGYKDCGW